MTAWGDAPSAFDAADGPTTDDSDDDSGGPPEDDNDSGYDADAFAVDPDDSGGSEANLDDVTESDDSTPTIDSDVDDMTDDWADGGSGYVGGDDDGGSTTTGDDSNAPDTTAGDNDGAEYDEDAFAVDPDDDSNRVDDEAYLDDITGPGDTEFTPDDLDDLGDLGVVMNTPGVNDLWQSASTLSVGGETVEGTTEAVRDAAQGLHDDYAHLLEGGEEQPAEVPAEEVEQPTQPPAPVEQAGEAIEGAAARVGVPTGEGGVSTVQVVGVLGALGAIGYGGARYAGWV